MINDTDMGKTVKMLTGKNKGKTGTIEYIYPAGTLGCFFTIIQIKITERLSGQFTPEQLQLVK